MLRHLPKIFSIGELTYATYYDFVALRHCTLRGFRRTLSLTDPLPQPPLSRAALVGRFHHRLMEVATQTHGTPALEAFIEAEICRLQSLVDSSPHLRRHGSVSAWDEVNLSARSARRALRNIPQARDTLRVYRERELKSKDGRLVGRPDYFSIEGTHAEIRDYKTGPLRDFTGAPDPQHVDQLRFYAALVYDEFSVSSLTGSIVGLKGDVISLDIASSTAETFADSVRDSLDIANLRRHTDIERLAAPSIAGCDGCPLHVVCPAYSAAQHQLELPGDQWVVSGVVKTVTVSANGAAVIGVATDVERNVLAIKVPADVTRWVALDSRRCFSRLRRLGRQYTWTSNSSLFSND